MLFVKSLIGSPFGFELLVDEDIVAATEATLLISTKEVSGDEYSPILFVLPDCTEPLAFLDNKVGFINSKFLMSGMAFAVATLASLFETIDFLLFS